MKFTLQAKDIASKARAGVLETAHGNIQTPIFMPVGTAGTVKAVHQHELVEDIQAQIILGNTYHLYLRPGLDVLHKAGGLHKFNHWDGPILTDSGGYQVYSLTEVRKIREEGVTFRSHIDGSKHLFTPENVMDTQRVIGADIIMAFDECTPYPCEYSYARKSLDMTHRWLKRCVDRFDGTEPLYGYEQTLFPIVQGSVYKDLREKSAEVIASFNRDGNAIGGLSVGEPAEEMYAMTEVVTNILPQDKPRYLMGVGTPINILENIALGIDMFDCVMPTRNARNGMLFTQNGIINIKNEKWKDDFSPIEAESDLLVDQIHTKAYLRHLIKSQEILGAQIASLHNLHFYLWLVKQAREKIIEGTFYDWKEKMVKVLGQRL
ncbi:tRNA guanosine(34) transglycosylase Tgt [Sphingobacterium chuzhouense]|uniref:Queuine tRNA-ribosyltransferase n=1 Tax=Sphingobacterium chuzhouense TaxID=1742264 RepID=A0ABR7XX18_9SPHI|nr:tRNA guanosine(34) transglycosylase Tgt [Sphingobacterium chuzhouense]MBD1423602.1 tRNA guanosine(34) transglycosylase Tgt [Sphingobacterium chuzhouense]